MQHSPVKHQRKPWQAQQCQVYISPLRYIVRLVGQVITVSVETVKLTNELAQVVRVEDWLGDAVEAKE